MGSEQPMEKSNIQTVTSLGSTSWVVCRSKSHNGRIYYFNTFTGEAAWNLSGPEIEKAKNRTQILQSQTGNEIEGCPEPKEPPVDNNLGSNLEKSQSAQVYIPPRIYNKQIINNQFSKPPCAPHTFCTNCNTHIGKPGIGDGSEVPVPHNCTPNVWAFQPNHQVMIAPSTSSLVVSQLQNPANAGYTQLDYFPVQNTSLPLSRRFNQLQDTIPNTNEEQRGISPYQRVNNNPNSNDLRYKLSARRSSKWKQTNENMNTQGRDSIENFNKTNAPKIEIIRPTMDVCDSDDKWLKENASVQGTQLVLNVSPLKNNVTFGERSSWYVVADTSVLLNNINLINVIVNSDEQCQLLVPDYIMAELQNISRLSNTQQMSRVYYVLQILSQQFAAGSAVVGKDPRNDSNQLYILDFCTKLLEQDHKLVLISDNVQLEKFRNTSNIPLLTVKELKELLTGGVWPNTTKRNTIYSLDAIKIIVPNDVVNAHNEKHGFNSFSVDTQRDYNKKQNSNELDRMSKQITVDIEMDGTIKKKTADVGVQTDFKSLFMNELPEKQDKSTITENCETDYDKAINNETTKRRGIQLKRNLSHPSSDNNIEKKQFKWRSRKRIESAPTNTATDKNLRSCNSPTSADHKMSVDCPNAVNNIDSETLNCESTNTSYDVPNDSSETGSSCYIHKTSIDKIVIEETSTSGIISNSASNVDSESMINVKPNEQIYNENVEGKDKNKCAMFEVESTAMEEYLKMRCDEWISRFVQIMEEVLTQILQQDPPFFNRTLPPPWTLHEATECIKKKFTNDSDVVDAANKLIFLLFKISDGQGKIKTELQPSEFMEMYSYGVYLIDSLQTILSSCEDLQTAADSLAKLLNDIVDPAETGHVDSFVETSVADVNVTLISTNEARTLDTSSNLMINDMHTQQIKGPVITNRETIPNEKKYNLRSSQKLGTQDYEQNEKPVKFIRKIDIESTFFKSLALHKSNGEIDNRLLRGVNKKDTSLSTAQQEKPNINTKDEIHGITPKNEPKIVRNFRRCLEFEEKLKNNDNSNMNAFNYARDLEEGEIDDEYDYYDDDYNIDYGNEGYEACDGMESDKLYKENEYQLQDVKVDENGNNIYDRIVGKIVNEIQEAFLEVHSFCEKSRDELCSVPPVSTSKRLEMREKAVKARLHMDILCQSLKGILCREETDYTNNLQAVLKEAGINLDGVKAKEYRNMISKYLHQANILLEAVNVVIETVS